MADEKVEDSAKNKAINDFYNACLSSDKKQWLEIITKVDGPVGNDKNRGSKSNQQQLNSNKEKIDYHILQFYQNEKYAKSNDNNGNDVDVDVDVDNDNNNYNNKSSELNKK